MTVCPAIDFDLIPAAVRAICQRLGEAGFAAYVVGGSVRDLLLRRSVHDWDVATAAPPEQVTTIFPRTVPTGIKHGTVTVLSGKLGVEVTTFRGEGAYSDGRRPDSVAFVRTIEEDLARRDFTMNALALDLLAQEIVDPMGGQEDIASRLIRAVGDPRERFTEDGLRPLRAVRFAAVLEFALEEGTLAAIHPCLDRFRLVSAERVRDELLKMLAAPRPSRGLELMRQTGLLATVLPELQAGWEVTQNRHHREDVYAHSLRVCDELPGDPLLRLAGALHDVGKPVTAKPHPDRPGENTFHRHEVVGAAIGAEVARRLRLSGAQQERLCHLVAQHIFPTSGLSDAALRRFLRRVGASALDDLFALRAADLRAKGVEAAELAALTRMRERLDAMVAAGAALSTGDLAIDGQAVMRRLGSGPGRHIGEILRALLERVLDDPELNREEALLELVDEIAAEGAAPAAEE